MNSVVKLEHKDVDAIPFQEASLDIWDKKYRLSAKDGTPVDKTMDDTYKRVARALADVELEPVRDQWYERFVWALRRGAIPAGRVTSNAGALEHKPATSTINCTVSGTIGDSMDDILNKVHEAGLTLKAGCGIGYEFSTLRPRGAYVSGAGAYTSGPLSFMDIYDKMCFTVSSAGGRRGAQMGTFDVGHPDALEFIRAKRENGRLRQFNLSLLVTDEFMTRCGRTRTGTSPSRCSPRNTTRPSTSSMTPPNSCGASGRATKNYVTREDGLVCCKIYKTLPARRMWDVIMTSTYDFAEPGFILIDRVNEMNNNWWCENIRATNPCVTADTWVQTSEGPRQVAELIGKPFDARMDGVDHASSPEGFFRTALKPLVKLATAEGHSLRLTSDHRVRRISTLTRFRLVTEWCAAGDLKAGDKVLLQDHRKAAVWAGSLEHNYSANEGYLMGLLVGDGTISEDRAELSIWARPAVGNSDIDVGGPHSVMAAALDAARCFNHRADFSGWHQGAGRGEFRLGMGAITELARDLGLRPGRQTVTPAIERASSEFYRGFLRGLFDTDGSVQGNQLKGVSVRLAQSDLGLLEGAQRMLLRLGIASSMYERAQHELVITGENVARFAEVDRLRRHGQTRAPLAPAGRLQAHAQSRAIRRHGRERRSRRHGRRVRRADSGHQRIRCQWIPRAQLRRAAAAALWLLPAGLGQSHALREECVHGLRRVRLERVPRSREGVHAHARQRVRDQRPAARAAAPRDHAQAPPWHGLPRAGQHHHLSRHEIRRRGFGEVHRRRLTRNGRGRMGSRARPRQGEGPGAHHERRVHGYRRDAAQASGNGQGRLEDRRPHSRAASCMRATASTCSAWPETAPWLVDQLANVGARFTHHTSIAPTGTISLSLANNASNGIEPSFAHHYFRNVIRPGKKSKEKVDVFSFELLAYRELINPRAMPNSTSPAEQLPGYFTTADDITPREHVDIQAAAQRWVDSSISKTANVPTDYKYESFKDIYLYAHEKDLKGCTTFRFNPEAFQGVLVKEDDLKNTTYVFTLEDGSEISVKGDEEIEYDGEKHTAANLYDALKEGYYGKF